MQKIKLSLLATGVFLLLGLKTASAAQINISIGDNLFSPKNQTINVGDTILWTNNDSSPHTVTADDDSFGSETLLPDETFSLVFDTPGTYPYFCLLHSTPASQGGSTMNATITVTKPAASSPSPAPNPTPAPSPTPSPPPAGGLTPPSGQQSNPASGLTMPGDSHLPSHIATLPTGSLINDSGTIYLIIGQTKVPFTNFPAFIGLGYSLANVAKTDSSTYSPALTYQINSPQQAHPWSSWLLYKGTVYYNNEDGMIGVPSWDIFTTNGGKASLLLPMNQADINQLKNNPNLPSLIMNDSRLYK